jgi:ankyrin repeat protein
MSDAATFFQAVKSGDAATVTTMLDADPNLLSSKNEQGQSAVLLASYSGRKEIRDLLLTRGPLLELHEAAAAGQLERVKQIVEKDAAQAKSFSPDGFPILALAAVFGHKPIVECLHAKGGDINAISTNGSGYTALTGAVASGHEEIVNWLLAQGANANYRYGAGYSPLLTAAANGHVAIVKLLLDYGADLHAKTNDGQTALSLAEARNHEQVAEFLRSIDVS